MVADIVDVVAEAIEDADREEYLGDHRKDLEVCLEWIVNPHGSSQNQGQRTYEMMNLISSLA